MKKRLIALLTIALTGCATAPDKIQTAYVSPIQYKDYDCDQVAAESARVNRRATELHSSLKSTADNDGAQMAVGMILFWPALFFLEGGDGPEAAEYARLKGERDALEQVSVQKKCVVATVPSTTPAQSETEPPEPTDTSVTPSDRINEQSNEAEKAENTSSVGT